MIDILEAGKVNKDYLSLLFLLIRPGESKVRDAVFDHLCNGMLQSAAADRYGVKQGSISRQISSLNRKHQIVKQIVRHLEGHQD